MAKSNEEMFTELVAIMDEIESTQCLYDFFDKSFVNKFYDVKVVKHMLRSIVAEPIIP